MGKNLTELLDSASVKKIDAGINNGTAFWVDYQMKDDSRVKAVFYPVVADTETWWSSTALSVRDLNKSANQLALLTLLLVAAAHRCHYRQCGSLAE